METDGTHETDRTNERVQRKRDEQMADVTSDLLAAVLAATPSRTAMALRVLRGDDNVESGVKKNTLPERFVTQRELVKMLGISAISLWRWKIPGHELGGRRRFRVSEVMAYLESPQFKALAAELKEKRREMRSELSKLGERRVKRGRGRPCGVPS